MRRGSPASERPNGARARRRPLKLISGILVLLLILLLQPWKGIRQSSNSRRVLRDDTNRAHTLPDTVIPILAGRQEFHAEESETADEAEAKGDALIEWVTQISGMVRVIYLSHC